MRCIKRLILRAPGKKGIYHAALLSTLTPRQVYELLDESTDKLSNPTEVLLAYAKLYDLRGGAVEIEFKQDKQGFGLTKRNKKSYFAQQIVQMLGSLAHNVLLWAKEWLSAEAPRLKDYGTVRIIRDVFVGGGQDRNRREQADLQNCDKRLNAVGKRDGKEPEKATQKRARQSYFGRNLGILTANTDWSFQAFTRTTIAENDCQILHLFLQSLFQSWR